MNYKNVKNAIQKLLEIIVYINSQGVIHRKVQPKYIIYDGNQLMLSGFGDSALFSHKIFEKWSIKFSLFTNDNPLFASPEMFKGNYTEKTDVWSIGVLTFLLLTGKFPFDGDDKN